MFSVVSESEIAAASTAHRARPWQIESVEIRCCKPCGVGGLKVELVVEDREIERI